MLTGNWNPHDEDDEMPACDVEWEFVDTGKYVYSQRVQVPAS